MTDYAREGKPRRLNYAHSATIASVYGNSAGDPSTSVFKWIDNYRGRGTPKDLFLSDDTEGHFQAAIQAGAQITKNTVRPSWPRHRGRTVDLWANSTVYIKHQIWRKQITLSINSFLLNDANPNVPPSLPMPIPCLCAGDSLHVGGYCLMENYFNLNPAMMSTMEVEMVYDLPDAAEGSRVRS